MPATTLYPRRIHQVIHWVDTKEGATSLCGKSAPYTPASYKARATCPECIRAEVVLVAKGARLADESPNAES